MSSSSRSGLEISGDYHLAIKIARQCPVKQAPRTEPEDGAGLGGRCERGGREERLGTAAVAAQPRQPEAPQGSGPWPRGSRWARLLTPAGVWLRPLPFRPSAPAAWAVWQRSVPLVLNSTTRSLAEFSCREHSPASAGLIVLWPVLGTLSSVRFVVWLIGSSDKTASKPNLASATCPNFVSTRWVGNLA